MKLPVLSLAAIFLVQGASVRAAAPARATVLVAAGEVSCAIVVRNEEPLSQRCAETLAEYLRQHAGAKPVILSGAELENDRHPALIVIDGSPGHPLLAKAGISLEVPADRADAYHVQTVQQKGRVVIAIAGRSPAGAKFGAYRLMEEMDMGPGRASIAPLDLTASPFFKTRSISLFNIWRVPVGVIRQCNLESWPAEKIQRNVAMYDAFGYNALETHDRFHEDFLQAVYGITRAAWRDKVHAMCDAAHAAGMTVFLRQWGNSVALAVKELEGGYTPFGFENLAPDIPEERRRWEREIRDYVATNYAAHIDHFIGHWADAGGIHAGSQATIKDAMLLHNELRAAFRALNPRIETSFNLWNMQNPKGHRGWPGYVDHKSVTTGVLEKDVIVAQATRARSHPYSEKVTREITADGYRAAVWSWRRADTEVRLGDPGLRVRIHNVMGDYFHGLPDSARQLEWHNIERNQHGIAIDVNFYVAGKLMWDPKADVGAALHRYCSLVFGTANASAMAEAFLTIEATRDVESQVSAYVVEHPLAAGKRARQALAAITKIDLSSGHRSRLPSAISPAEMLDEMRATLAVIIENAGFCAQELPAIDALIESDRKDDARARAAVLRQRADEWSGTIAGGMEGLWLKETLEARLAENALLRFDDSLGWRINNVASLEEIDGQIAVTATGGATGVALLELPQPIHRHAEFHVRCTVAETGASRNGGLVFGSALTPDALIRCQAFIGGRDLRISGRGLVKPIRLAVPNLETMRPLDCTVVVDLDRHRVTFTVGGYSAEAELKESVAALRYYGVVVDRAKSRFGKIDVIRAD